MHTHIEYKTADGRWLHYAAPHVKADYRLFSLIAGVRNDTNMVRPIVPPKGLPENLSEITAACLAQDRDMYHLHHETWLSADEFIELQKLWNITNQGQSLLDLDFEESVFRCYGPGGSALASHNGFEDMRAVFWFDD